jgi:hypothetical protein
MEMFNCFPSLTLLSGLAVPLHSVGSCLRHFPPHFPLVSLQHQCRGAPLCFMILLVGLGLMFFVNQSGLVLYRFILVTHVEHSIHGLLHQACGEICSHRTGLRI